MDHKENIIIRGLNKVFRSMGHKTQSKNIAFVAIPKTGSQSVTNALEPFGLRYYNVKHEDHHRKLEHGIISYTHFSVPHLRAEGIVTDAFINSAFKFAIVRNPWDRLVSLYSFLHAHPADHRDPYFRKVAAMDSFEAFVKDLEQDPPVPIGNFNYRLNSQANEQLAWITDESGEVWVDFVGRFEQLQADWTHVCRETGIDCLLPHLNKSKHRDFRTYYTDELCGIVAKLYANDIRTFGYTFEPGASENQTSSTS